MLTNISYAKTNFAAMPLVINSLCKHMGTYKHTTATTD